MHKRQLDRQSRLGHKVIITGNMANREETTQTGTTTGWQAGRQRGTHVDEQTEEQTGKQMDGQTDRRSDQEKRKEQAGSNHKGATHLPPGCSLWGQNNAGSSNRDSADMTPSTPV